MVIINLLNNIFHDKIPFLILLNFILLILLIYLNWRYIKSFLLKIDKKTWIILISIFIIALSIRIFIPPHQHIIYIDESWYMEAGKDMLQTGNQGDYSKSIGWPFILRIAFNLFGTNNWVALYTSLLLGALTVFPIFFMAFIITKRKDLSLVSSLLFSLFPTHIRWSTSAETNVASLFFISLTIFFCFLYYINKKNSLLWLSITSLAFTAQFRPENYSLIPLFIIGCIIFNKPSLKKFNFILPFLVMIILSSANLIQVLDLQTSSNWIESDTAGKQTGSNWSISNLFQNSLKYGINLFNGEYQPVIISILWVIGLLYMFRKQKKESLFLTIWFILYWLIYFASWFQTLQGKDRFYISFYPIIVIFAAYGIFSFSKLITKKLTIKCNVLIITTVVVLFFVPYVIGSAYKYSDNAHLLETKIPELAEKDIPSSCVIIANWPTILKSTTNLDVIGINLFLYYPQYQEKILNSTDCILFFEDYCCLDWETYNYKEKCDEIKNMFLLKVFKEYKEKDKTYTFYKISRVIE